MAGFFNSEEMQDALKAFGALGGLGASGGAAGGGAAGGGAASGE